MRPKILKTPVRDSPHKVRVANDLVRTPKLADTAETANKSPGHMRNCLIKAQELV